MVINVDVDRLMAHNISLSQYLTLLYLYNDDLVGLVSYMGQFRCPSRGDIDNLVDEGYLVRKNSSEDLKYLLTNLTLTSKFAIFAPQKVDDWINEWYDLWPQKVKSGGYYLRSDRNGCKNKMNKFIKQHPEYTKDIILEATKLYLQEQEEQSFNYTKLAPYFIEKNGLSMLSGYCEAVLGGHASENETSTFIGEI